MMNPLLRIILVEDEPACVERVSCMLQGKASFPYRLDHIDTLAEAFSPRISLEKGGS